MYIKQWSDANEKQRATMGRN